MLDDVPGLLNPIVQAMIHTADLKKQYAQQDIEKERNAQEAAARKEQLKQAQQVIDYTHEHNLAQLEAQKLRDQADIESHRASVAHTMNMIGAGGGNADAIYRGIAPQLYNTIRNGGNFQPTQNSVPSANVPDGTAAPQLPVQGGGQAYGQQSPLFQTPQGEAQRVYNLRKSESQGQAEGALPSEMKLKDIENRNKLTELGVQGQNNKDVANIHGQYQLSGDRINGQYHLAGVRLMHQLVLDDGSGQQAAIAKSLTDGLFDGSKNWSQLTPDEKRVATAYAQGTGDLAGMPTDGKAYAAKLDSVSRMQTLLNQYRDLAANYSRDSPNASAMGNQNVTLPIVGTLQRTVPGSDLESKLAAMKSSGGALATFFDQNNRKSDQEIIRSVMGSFDPKATVAQNSAKLQQHTDQLKNVVKQTFVGMQPDRVNKVLGDRGISDFGAFGGSDLQAKYERTATGPNGHKIGLKAGKWYDVQSGEEVK